MRPRRASSFVADGFGHDEITPEDMLRGLVREAGGAVPRSTREEICRALEVGEPWHRSRGSHLGPRLTDTSCRILAHAREEAGRAGGRQVVPRHLLAGILAEEQTAAARLLRRHGVTQDWLRNQGR